LKEYECVEVSHHRDIGKSIEKWQRNGWRLHTYVCAGNANMAMGTVHYLLFERGE
jgi:hypothetical protein